MKIGPALAVATMLGLGGLGLAGIGAIVARAADPNALWKIVHDRCVPNAAGGNPTPCTELSADDAVLKDIVGNTQFLLIPTARITGIESPAILADGAPNFFADAWRAEHFIYGRLGHALPREDVALVINPPSARSQEQLHIHIDCIRPDIRDALRQQSIGDGWTMLPVPLAGQRYLAMRLPGETLDRNPFRIVAETIPGAREAMGNYTLILAGANDPKSGPGFILLAGHVGAEGAGHGEDLEDHSCVLGAETPAG